MSKVQTPLLLEHKKRRGPDLEFGHCSHRKKRKEARSWLIDFFCPIEFNPSEAILKKLEINEKKYPVEKARGSAK
jgi:hypothetical protein